MADISLSAPKATPKLDKDKKKRKTKPQKQEHQGPIEVAEPTFEEKQLTESLFGTSVATTDEQPAEEGGWWMSTSLEDNDGSVDHQDQKSTSKKPKKRAVDSAVAWHDEDDNSTRNIRRVSRLRKLKKEQEDAEVTATELEERLRERFMNTYSETSWAELPEERKKRKKTEAGVNPDDQSDDEGEDEGGIDGLLASTKATRRTTGDSSVLSAGGIDIIRCKDANAMEPSNAVVQAMQFHPQGEILFTAGLDKSLRFFGIDGESNQKMHSVFFNDLPIMSAHWTMGGDQVLLTGRRPYFYVYDAMSGGVTRVSKLQGSQEKSLERAWGSPDGRMTAFTAKNGIVLLMDNRTRQLSMEVRMSGTARSVAWPARETDDRYLVTSGGDADVYVWDMRSTSKGSGLVGSAGKCVSRWANEGGLPTSSMAAHRNTLAVAAESGVVNIYDLSTAGLSGHHSTPPLRRSLMNLQTPVESLKFNHDGQILGMGTRWDKNSFRLVHLPSCTVFSNWPTSKTPINYLFSMDFSPKSGFLALGNDRGKVLLYRLNHYRNA